jgi:hypothetical protein
VKFGFGANCAQTGKPMSVDVNTLLWGLLGCVLFPIWLITGLVDFWTHQRTSIATTAGVKESILHTVQAVEIGIAVMMVLFLEINPLALSLLVLLALAHTVTAWVDLRYASERRRILPLEQAVHSFLFTLPLFATAILSVLHWPAWASATDAVDAWTLHWRRAPWQPSIIASVVSLSLIFGFLPALAELRQTWMARSTNARKEAPHTRSRALGEW